MSTFNRQQLTQAIANVKAAIVTARDRLEALRTLPEEESESDLAIPLRTDQARLKSTSTLLQEALVSFQNYIERQPPENQDSLENVLATFPTLCDELDQPANEDDTQWPCFKLLHLSREVLDRIEGYFLSRADSLSLDTGRGNSQENINKISELQPAAKGPANSHPIPDLMLAPAQSSHSEQKRPSAPEWTPDPNYGKSLNRGNREPFQFGHITSTRFSRPANRAAFNDDEDDDDFSPPPPSRRLQSQKSPLQTTFRQFRLDPPQFDGDPKEWGTFWLAFRRSIHDQPVPNYEKHLCLLQSLTKNSVARKAVDAYPPSDDNYPIVIRILEAKFGDAKALREKLISELLHLPVAQNTLASLRNTHEHIERICLQLQTAKSSTPFQEEIVCEIIRSKLPESTMEQLLDWEYQSARDWTLAELRQGINRIVSVKERLERSVAILRPPQRQKTSNRDSSPDPRTDQMPRRDNRSDNRRDFHPESVRNFAVTRN
jgi:hypothetical protein